jgi:hypothetical protein
MSLFSAIRFTVCSSRVRAGRPETEQESFATKAIAMRYALAMARVSDEVTVRDSSGELLFSCGSGRLNV